METQCTIEASNFLCKQDKPVYFHIYRLANSYFLQLSVVLLFLKTVSFAQQSKKLDSTAYIIAEKQPQFPGGMNALTDYLKATVNYPAEAIKADIKGKVFLSFFVEIDGRLTDITLLNRIGYGCDEEAIRVVSLMPLWEPGSYSDKPLRVRYNLPVLFGIDYPKRKGH